MTLEVSRQGDEGTADGGVHDIPPGLQRGPDSPARRRFLSRLSLALGALGGALVGVPVIGFILGPLFRGRPLLWRPVGRLGDFRIGETVEASILEPSPLAWAGPASLTAVWLRREGELTFIAFSVNCTHLGCPVRWLASSRLFMCPCHGGVFYADGAVAAGPPRHALVRYPVRVLGENVEVLSGISPIGSEVNQRSR
jgi:menaquinol-cytochrome c reductase iron-sulfur subunit